MSFNPSALNERTLKQFVDRLAALRKTQEVPKNTSWPPKRAQLQEEVAKILGFTSWHQAIHAVRPEVKKSSATVAKDTADTASFSRYPNEPAQWTAEAFDEFLVWAVEQGASDIFVESDKPIEVLRHGQQQAAGQRTLSNDEISMMCQFLIKDTPNTGRWECVHFSHTIKVEENTHRFVGQLMEQPSARSGTSNIFLALGLSPSKPPSLSNSHFSQQVIDIIEGNNGLVVIAGKNSSDRKFLLSSVMQHRLKHKQKLNMFLFEEGLDLEYDHHHNRVVRTDISITGRQGQRMVDRLNNAMRRMATDIGVSNILDLHVCEVMMTAAMTGHRACSTIESEGCADAIGRMIRLFKPEEHRARTIDILSSLRLMIGVQMIEATNGTQIPLYETLIFNDDVVDNLIANGLDRNFMAVQIATIMKQQGTDFASEAQRLHEAGTISAQTYREVVRRSKHISD